MRGPSAFLAGLVRKRSSHIYPPRLSYRRHRPVRQPLLVMLGQSAENAALSSRHLSRLFSVSGTMASARHSVSHTPQSMHSFGLMLYCGDKPKEIIELPARSL
jgi:hypothetical protein